MIQVDYRIILELSPQIPAFREAKQRSHPTAQEPTSGHPIKGDPARLTKEYFRAKL